MPLSIASDGEIEEIAELVNASYRGEGGWTNEIGQVEGERTNAGALRADLAAQPNARLLVWRGETHGPIQSCVRLESSDEGNWYLGMLTVHPRFQDRKLGRTVLEAAEAYALTRGARSIRMTVVNIRETLIAWYERRGYCLTGETQPFPYDDDRFGAPMRGDLYFVVLEKSFGD
jgi:ribosomal protein S18 acetylase RimI-like enzyme